MSQPNPALKDPNHEIEQATWKFFERITPWLLEIGSWIFGGLIAFNLIIIGPLITLGPVDSAIMVSITTFALALPLNVAGLFVLRMVRDLEPVEFEFDFESEVRQAMQSFGPAIGEQAQTAPPLRSLEAVRKRRTRFALMYSSGILTLSIALTLAGMIAALWHIAWWIAVAFAIMVLISLVIVSLAVATAQPPASAEERERMRRYGQEVARRAKEQSQGNNERA